MSIKLSRSESAIDVSDVEVLENQISTHFPDSFKQFFMTHNGGVPDRDWWDGDEENEAIRLKRFKAIARSDAQDASDTKYLGGCYKAMTGRKVIPATLLPFAIDDGGNFFCLDLVDGGVCFYAADCFDSDLTITENQLNAYRWLAQTFDAFVSGLKYASDVDF